MAFEPLGTDEKRDPGDKTARPKDIDSQMLLGCGGFLIAAVGGYVLSIWPFVVFQQVERLSTLLMALGFSAIPALTLGSIVTRRLGLAGACGMVGGALTTAIFLFLRLEQAFLSALAEQSPRPEYPEAYRWLVPLGYVLAAIFLAALFFPKEPTAADLGPEE